MVGVSTSAPELVSVAQDVRQFLETPRASEQDGEKRSRPRQRRPREVSGQDEASLSWFFGQGLSIYDKSTFGPIVEKIQLDGYSSTVCGKCDGAGIIEEKGGVTLDDKCQSCDGSGLHPRKAGESQKWCLTCDGLGRVVPYEVVLDGGGWCPSCKGTGSGCVERRALRRQRCSWCKPDPIVVANETLGGTTKYEIVAARVPTHCCPNCLGTGDEPLTAKRMQKDDEGGGVLGNDTALTRFAITSRRADRVKAISPALHAALEAFYGDVGNRWARTPFGRMFALYHLTSAGKKLARMGIENPDRKVTGKTKKKKALKYAQLIAAAVERCERGEADRLAKEKEAADRRAAAPPPRDDDELAAVELNAQERIGVQANVQKSQPTDKRRDLLAAAQVQAEALYSRAAAAWNRVATPKGDKEAAARLLVNLTRLGHGSLATKLRSAGQFTPREIAQAKESMRAAGVDEMEITEAFQAALSETAGGAA